MRRERSRLPTGKVAALRQAGHAPSEAAAAPEPLEPESDPMLAFASEKESESVAPSSRNAQLAPAPAGTARSTPSVLHVAMTAAVILGQLGLLGVWFVRRGAASPATAAIAADPSVAAGAAGTTSAVAASAAPNASTSSAVSQTGSSATAPGAATAPKARVAAAGRHSFATGWLSVSSPITAQIFENGLLLGSTDARYLSLSAGRHHLELVNKALGYRENSTVEINPSQITSILLDMPRGTLHITALPWAEVWIDGAHVGDTPLANLSLPVGTHEIVFRHPRYGSHRQVVVVGTRQTLHVGVDLRNAHSDGPLR